MTSSLISVVNNIAYPSQGSRTRAADAAGYGAARATRDYSLITADWKQALVLEGRAYAAKAGAFSTPVDGGGATAVISLVRPRVALSIPSGTTIIPLRVAVQCQTPLLAADNEEIEILLGIDRTQANAAGTSTAVTKFNLRTDNAYSSLCTVTAVHTADLATSPVLGIELARKVKVGDVQGTAATTMWTDLDLLYPLVGQHAPVIVGPASLLVYWGGTVATTGFAQVEWAEFVTATDITA